MAEKAGYRAEIVNSVLGARIAYLVAAAAARAGLLALGPVRGCTRLLWRYDDQRMRRHLKTVCSDIISERVGVQTIATIDGITRVRSGGRCHCNANDDHHQHERASHHLAATSQNAKSSLGPTRRSLYRRTATFDVRTSYSAVVVSDRLLAKLYLRPTSAE